MASASALAARSMPPSMAFVRSSRVFLIPGSANLARPPNTTMNAMMPMISSSIGTERTEGISSPSAPDAASTELAAAMTLITT